MIQINDALAIARADVESIARFIERRGRFLDALDWSMMTDAQVRQSSMLDELLDEDLAIGLHYIDWLIDRVDSQGPTLALFALRRIPRPWHAEWNTLAA